ncbi:hypothetical protein BW723_04155 [Polaribacter reichenbachii]|uniref:Secretion system C-terminal sorting domain-containing protein n=1 Tax=Polaribacter reichenbachii TaxID=996801 RepID=A0A1B8TVA8_9FLAO|nr:T9SS type A sorting domain-containing protein [Polaribacter reichenbachii]APZ45534.1 hypothetical protein BW723_04155 [Polaribacter reichenbachii]AUC19396.1 hypothetical protein BTO17_12160 [Polaribacter reichenbachii]OBY63449.1 hypothetical protein LPB301_11555 [Polaribacter reichenbachii]
MFRKLLFFGLLLVGVSLQGQTGPSITIDSAPLTVEVGGTIAVTVSFDAGDDGAGTDYTVDGNVGMILREYDTTTNPEGIVWKNAGNVSQNGVHAGTVNSNNLQALNTVPSADLDPGKEYRIVCWITNSDGVRIEKQQVITVIEGPNIKYTSLPTEIAAGISGVGVGKGSVKTIVTWSNVTPGSTLYNQLRDANGVQVGGKTYAITTADGSQEIEWGYFGGGELVAGTTGTINSNYAGTTDLSEPVSIVNDITRWTGSSGTDWDTAGNWTNGVPTASLKAVVPDVFNLPVASGSVTAIDLTLQDEASLAVSGAVTASGSVTLNSGSSLTATSLSGALTYNRSLSTPDLTGDSAADNSAGWYLVSSPVSGETYDDTWVTNNDIAYGSGDNRGISTYVQADDTWSYMQSGGGNSFNEGIGYSMKRASTGDVSFTGSFRASNITDIALTIDGSNGYNLVGNPFIAYLSLSDLMTANNSGGNDLLTESTIWMWDSANKTYNATTGSVQIAPGQGFFVEASAAASTFTVNTSMLSTQTADTFQKTATTEIQLNITDGDLTRYAKLNYVTGATKEFDNSKDAKLFGGVAQPFAVYTSLLSNNVGKKYQIQSLPNSDFESMIVPVGINAAADKEITFSAAVLNLPSGINVYLEDRQTNTFTRLDEANSTYKVTLTAALNDTGRFYLHTRASVLSTDNLELDTISIYKTNNSTLRITGLTQGKSSLKLFNILGKQVLNTSFTSNGVSDVNLPSLATGIYIVQLSTENGMLNKKITLE